MVNAIDSALQESEDYQVYDCLTSDLDLHSALDQVRRVVHGTHVAPDMHVLMNQALWPKAMLCTIFSTIWVCSHNLTICSQFGLISWDLGAVRCVSMVLSWLENMFFGNESFIRKIQCFSTLIFLFSDSFHFFLKNTMIFE